MANVGLNAYTIREIVNRTKRIIKEGHKNLPKYPQTVSSAVADEAYELLLPMANEKAIRKLLPAWYSNEAHSIYIGAGTRHPEIWRANHSILTNFSEPRFCIGGIEDGLSGITGISELRYDGSSINIIKASDGSVIEQPNLRKFVEEMCDIQSAHDAADVEVNKAAADIEAFLKDHRTLQKAVKVFGPALMEFVPPHIKEVYDRPSQQRQRKPKAPPHVFDKDYLITAAVSSRLNLH